MLSKEFKKYITEKDLEQFKTVFKKEFSDENYLLFLRKFRGSMIYRGNSSLSYKLFDNIWKGLKIYMNEQKTPQKVHLAFKRAVFNLIPLLSTSNIRKGKKVQVVPVLLKQQRRIVLINKWLLSSQKNKSNVRGIQIELIVKLIVDAIRKKGNAYGQKVENSKKAYNSRYILLRPKERNFNVGFNNLQRYVLRKLKERYSQVKEDVKESDDLENLIKFVSALKFLKIKTKSRFYNKKKKELRKILFLSWEASIPERIYSLMNWLNSSNIKKTKFILNKTILIELINKYYKIWKKKKQNI